MDINAQRTNSNEDKISSRARERTSVTSLKVGASVTGRIVTGFEVRNVHWWPTLSEDQATKTMKNTWRTAYVDGNTRSPLDAIGEIDKSMQIAYLKSTGGDVSGARSILAKKSVYLFAWIKRVPGQTPKVEILEANWSVAQEINNIRTQISPANPEMLYYGLPYMFDICISKGTNPKTGYPQYKVAPFQCATEGKVAVKFLEEEKNPIENKTQFFSQEDLAAIQACEWELKEQDKLISSTELIAKLGEFPIDLGRRAKDGTQQFLFFRTGAELSAIQAAINYEGVAFMLPSPQEVQALPPATDDFANKVATAMQNNIKQIGSPQTPAQIASTPAAEEVPATSKPVENTQAITGQNQPIFGENGTGGNAVTPQAQTQTQVTASSQVAHVEPVDTQPVLNSGGVPTQAIETGPVAQGACVQPGGQPTATTPSINPVVTPRPGPVAPAAGEGTLASTAQHGTRPDEPQW